MPSSTNFLFSLDTYPQAGVSRQALTCGWAGGLVACSPQPEPRKVHPLFTTRASGWSVTPSSDMRPGRWPGGMQAGSPNPANPPSIATRASGWSVAPSSDMRPGRWPAGMQAVAQILQALPSIATPASGWSGMLSCDMRLGRWPGGVRTSSAHPACRASRGGGCCWWAARTRACPCGPCRGAWWAALACTPGASQTTTPGRTPW